jgi:AraC-like DNA-binding protein
MSTHAVTIRSSLSTFAPPYTRFEPRAIAPFGEVSSWRGSAVVWRLQDGVAQAAEFTWLRDRPRGLPLIVLLPPPEEVIRTLPLLPRLRDLGARAVLPDGALGTPERTRQLLSSPPLNIADAVTSYLTERGMLASRKLHGEVHRILELSTEVQSISGLARRMYTSRRTLGRHFSSEGVPVPSHWLQFGRLLHVCLQLQMKDATIFRVAHRARYPDGFTMSNQMKRVLGIRPSEASALIGWVWIVESWLDVEGRERDGGREGD